ncbi:MAG: hypothetical protein DCC55_37435 [Chloroflexi bacterium]|nr:MAG: hypothetical protein DCC55_37435 [Chloroflexota bacterium]
MRFDLAWFRDPYRPGVGPVVQSWIKPQRRNLLVFRRYWPWLRLVTISTLIVLATLPMQIGPGSWLVALAAVVIYILAMIGFELTDHYVSSPIWQQHLGGVRKLAGLLALIGIHWFLPAASTELWLLYLIPMMTLGVDLDRTWATGLIFLTMILMFFSAWPFTDQATLPANWLLYLRTGVFRAIMSGFIGLTSYLLSRCLAYQSNTTREVLSRLFNVRNTDRWLNNPNAVAGSIADLLSEPASGANVHVLLYDSTLNKMKLLGSSSPAGEELAHDGFRFDASRGITGWAARTGEPCFINDTTRDPEQRFFRSSTFPNTRSALAVPISLDDQHTAVLEIESLIPNDVAFEDLQLMNHVAHYLRAAHQRSDTLDFHQQLAELGRELADRIIQVDEISVMLEKIGEVALGLLNADIIRFYYRNPDTDRIEQRCTVGALYMPDAEDSPVNDPESIVFQLMEATRLQPFTDALNDPRLTRKLGWHRQRNCEPFVVREGIRACAAMPLVIGQERLGLIWVNYRHEQTFSMELASKIEILATYAVQAINSGVQTASAEKKRRDTTRRIVHDSLAHRLHDVVRGLRELDHYTPGSPAWNRERVIIQCQVERARRVVANLVGEQAWFTLQSVIDDLVLQTQLIEKYYCIPTQFSICKVPDTPISIAGGNELMFTCDEILGNVVRHSHADMLSVSVEINHDLLEICIKDNGIGFNTKSVRLGQGIASVQDRIARLGGVVDICSEPGKGTCISLAVPLSETVIVETKNVTGI